MRDYETFEHKGRRFRVEFERDDATGAPWSEFDGHGPVTGWTRRDKQPGELVLHEDRGAKRYYDLKEATAIAKRDQWGPALEGETKGQTAARCARQDYAYLRAWCRDDWQYVVVVVTLLDADGSPTEEREALGGVETWKDYHLEAWRDLADEIISRTADTGPRFSIVLTEQEFDNVLAALRHWQETMAPTLAGDDFEDVDGCDHFYRHQPLTVDELEEFIERINTKDAVAS